jgi:hypothetical protein
MEPWDAFSKKLQAGESYSSSTNAGKHMLGFFKRGACVRTQASKSAAMGNYGGIYTVIKTLEQYIS